MHTIIRSLLAAGLLAVPLASLGQVPESEIPRTSGKVLVLDNERIMQGDIEREGDRYRIRRATGETWVPVDKVKQVCDSLEEVYRGMRGRANLRDVDELLKLARWSHQHGLREQARTDVQAILALKPRHAEALRLAKLLQKPVPAPSPGPNAAVAIPTAAQDVESVLPTSFGLTLEAQGVFGAKVQTILMNACASCHATGRGGAFKLVRAYNDGSTNRRATQQNIAASMGQINPDDWQASPFLVKAVSIHGEGAQPPLKNRQHAAYRLLEDWVQQVVADMPRKPAQIAAAPAPALLSERTIFAATPLPGSPVSKDAPKTEAQPPNAKPPEMPVKEVTPQPVGPADPFDPAPFNQQPGRGSR